MSKQQEDNGESLGRLWRFLTVTGLGVVFLSAILFPGESWLFLRTVKLILVNFWWLILPPFLWALFDILINEYNEMKFWSRIEYDFLELIPNRDIEKSPKLMEHVFAGLWNYSTPNRLEVYCGWRPFQPKMSFEIMGGEGKAHFCVRCPKVMTENVMSHIQAQYPDVEIIKTTDYSQLVPKNLPNRNWDVWGSVLVLNDPNPLPLRTYKYFQESVTGQMVDPLANVVEVMNNLPKNQHAWFQIVIMPEVPKNWHPASEAYIKQMLDEYAGKKKEESNKLKKLWQEIVVMPVNFFKGLFLGGDLFAPAGSSSGGDEGGGFDVNKLPPGVKERVLAISDNMSKPAFNTTLRLVYTGTKDGFNKSLGVGGIFGALKQFADVNYNDIIPSKLTKTFANYYFDKERLLYKKRKIIADYRSRAFAGMSFIMNTETLATLFHFPDMTIRNSAVARIESRREDAPPDLPLASSAEMEKLGKEMEEDLSPEQNDQYSLKFLNGASQQAEETSSRDLLQSRKMEDEEIKTEAVNPEILSKDRSSEKISGAVDVSSSNITTKETPDNLPFADD